MIVQHIELTALERNLRISDVGMSSIRHSMPHSQTTRQNEMRSSDIPLVGRLTCSVAEACKATGLGRTKIYALIAEGCLRSTTIGRRRLIDVVSLRKILEPR